MFLQSVSTYATTDRLKKCLVKDDLYYRSVTQIRETPLRVKVACVTIL